MLLANYALFEGEYCYKGNSNIPVMLLFDLFTENRPTQKGCIQSEPLSPEPLKFDCLALSPESTHTKLALIGHHPQRSSEYEQKIFILKIAENFSDTEEIQATLAFQINTRKVLRKVIEVLIANSEISLNNKTDSFYLSHSHGTVCVSALILDSKFSILFQVPHR